MKRHGQLTRHNHSDKDFSGSGHGNWYIADFDLDVGSNDSFSHVCD